MDINARIENHEARIANLEKVDGERRDALQRIEAKIDGHTKWLMGVMASALLSLVAIIIALLSGKPITVH